MNVPFISAASSRRRLISLLVLSLAALALAPCTPAPPVIGELKVTHALPTSWRALVPGLDSAQLSFTRKSDSTRVIIAAYRIDPARWRFGLLFAPELTGEPVASLQQLAQKAGPVLAVNASFYLPETFKPIGLMVSAGRTLNSWKPGAGSGIFWAGGAKAGIDWARERRESWDGADAAVQAGPLILEPGGAPGIRANTQKYHPRTAVGLDREGRVIMLCTLRRDELDVGLAGLDLYELMEVLQADPGRGGLGLASALNLDGGVSTSLALNLPGERLNVLAVHPVPVGLAVFPR
jgi:uncharacterized protein YigE (DUF2233 family)